MKMSIDKNSIDKKLVPESDNYSQGIALTEQITDDFLKYLTVPMLVKSLQRYKSFVKFYR